MPVDRNVEHVKRVSLSGLTNHSRLREFSQATSTPVELEGSLRFLAPKGSSCQDPSRLSLIYICTHVAFFLDLGFVIGDAGHAYFTASRSSDEHVHSFQLKMFMFSSAPVDQADDQLASAAGRVEAPFYSSSRVKEDAKIYPSTTEQPSWERKSSFLVDCAVHGAPGINRASRGP